jgi:hypothetical protein
MALGFNKMNTSIKFQKKGEREITDFLAQESLLDYIEDTLDAELKRKIEDKIKNNPEIKLQLKCIQESQMLCRTLAQASSNDKNIKSLSNHSSDAQDLLMKLGFYRWSTGHKFIFEALFVSFGVVALCMVIPWDKLLEIKLPTSNSILLQQTRHKNLNSSDIEAEDSKILSQTEDKVKKAEAIVVTAVPEAPIEKETTKKQNKAIVGVLYRGQILIPKIEDANAKLVDRISEIGARKAGDVPLGWRRGSGSYFHFTLPESKYQDVQKIFNEFGVLKIAKEKHDRVMPEGTIRLIINVEEK